MRYLISLFILLLLLLSSCTLQKIDPGHMGVKVFLYADEKGVSTEEVGPGRYWLGINTELFEFPTFTQNYVWTKDRTEGSEDDESITFQSKEGMSLNADIGISYYIQPDKVSNVFQKYRRGVDEITDIFLRNHVRDAFVHFSSSENIEYLYGEGKKELLEAVNFRVKNEVDSIGITVEKIYAIGDFRLPEKVREAIDAKIEAKQRAQQRENEVAEQKAEGEKLKALAEGNAQAIKLEAEAEAYAIRVKTQALSNILVEYEKVRKWNGALPTVTGGAVPIMNIEK